MAMTTIQPRGWTAVHNPAANTQATVSKAAGAAGQLLTQGEEHVCTGISASIAGTAASSVVHVYLRDGASGAGTILWSAVMVCAANASDRLDVDGLHIIGTAETAMTLEFDGAGGLNTTQSVALRGYTRSAYGP